MSEANRNAAPFTDEKPQLVHFEKDESHYEYCRMQMHDIDKIHRRTFLCNTSICILVCFLAIFRFYVAGFDLFSHALATADRGGSTPAGATLAAGMFEILVALAVIILGYLAWANFRILNLFLGLWYATVTITGIVRLDIASALIGVIGVVFYFFSFRAMAREQALSEMPGYPNFQEKFDISKSDIVIQTLLAHQGEHRTKSTLFTTDYSLRRKKKKSAAKAEGEPDALHALADELQKHIDKARDAKQTPDPAEESPAEGDVTAPEGDAAENAAAESAENAPAETASGTASAEESAAAILAEAEAKAKEILAEALAKAEAVKAEQAAAPKAAPEKPAQQNTPKKKKKR